MTSDELLQFVMNTRLSRADYVFDAITKAEARVIITAIIEQAAKMAEDGKNWFDPAEHNDPWLECAARIRRLSSKGE